MDVCSGRSTVPTIAISTTTSVVILEYDESGSGTRCKRVDTGNVRCCETECTVNHNYLVIGSFQSGNVGHEYMAYFLSGQK